MTRTLAMKACMFIGLGIGSVSCSSGGAVPNPVPIPDPVSIEKTVTWQWEPGTCRKIFTIYQVMTNGERVPMVETIAANYSKRIVPQKSQWIVSGKCDEGEYFSEEVTLQP